MDASGADKLILLVQTNQVLYDKSAAGYKVKDALEKVASSASGTGCGSSAAITTPLRRAPQLRVNTASSTVAGDVEDVAVLSEFSPPSTSDSPSPSLSINNNNSMIQSLLMEANEITKQNKQLHKIVERTNELATQQAIEIARLRDNMQADRQKFNVKATQCKEVIGSLHHRNTALTQQVDELMVREQTRVVEAKRLPPAQSPAEALFLQAQLSNKETLIRQLQSHLSETQQQAMQQKQRFEADLAQQSQSYSELHDKYSRLRSLTENSFNEEEDRAILQRRNTELLAKCEESGVRYDNLLKEYKQLCDDHHNVLRMKKEAEDRLPLTLNQQRLDVAQIQQLEQAVAEKDEKCATLLVQLEVYKDDFELERAAREKLHGENCGLNDDLMKLRNVMHMQRRHTTSPYPARFTHTEPAAQGAEGGPDGAERPFECPICSRTFEDCEVLQTHCEQCEAG